jgi:hypothetical protein
MSGIAGAILQILFPIPTSLVDSVVQIRSHMGATIRPQEGCA